MNPGNFFAELTRRNVYKVTAAYAVVGWLLLQAASILFPAFDAPPWVMRLFIIYRRARISAGAGFFLGIRNHTGRDQA